jgi:Arc/MetJ-type ribon-helix-helix transcriptional regulator
MAGLRVHVVMSPDLVERVDRAKAMGESRGEFVRRALEQALGKEGTTLPGQQPTAERSVEEPRPRHQSRPVPARAPYVRPFNPRPKGKP